MGKFNVGNKVAVYCSSYGYKEEGEIYRLIRTVGKIKGNKIFVYGGDKILHPVHIKQCRRLVKRKKQEYCRCSDLVLVYKADDPGVCAKCFKCFKPGVFGVFENANQKIEALEKRVSELERFENRMTCERCEGIVKHEQIYKRCECF